MRKKKVLCVVVIGACLLGFAILLYLVVSAGAAAFDDPVREFLYGLRSSGLTAIMKIVTYMGNWQIITLLCIVLLAIKKTGKTYGIPVSAGAIFVTVLNKIIKHVVERPRPADILHLIEEGGFSFASGHSITSMCVYGMLIYLMRTNMQNRTAANILTVCLAIPMVFVGISRIYLGVHYPTDVLAGWLLGVAVITTYILFRRESSDSLS